MLFKGMKRRARSRRSSSHLPCLQFVDGRNRPHYLFRVMSGGGGSAGEPYVDLKQIRPGRGLTNRGMVIRTPIGAEKWSTR